MVPSIASSPVSLDPVSTHASAPLDIVQEEDLVRGAEDGLAGYIFKCNRVTKPQCFQYRVFGLPYEMKYSVEKIKPGTSLFLYDCDEKLLYGVYMATSDGNMSLEPQAFSGMYPAQVRFRIFSDCLPLKDFTFKRAIRENFQRRSNTYYPELDNQQVRSLLSLFRPITDSSNAAIPYSLRDVNHSQMTGHSFVNSTAQYPTGLLHSENPYPSSTSWNRVSPTLNPTPQHQFGVNMVHTNAMTHPSSFPYVTQSYPMALQDSRNQPHLLASQLHANYPYAAQPFSEPAHPQQLSHFYGSTVNTVIHAMRPQDSSNFNYPHNFAGYGQAYHQGEPRPYPPSYLVRPTPEGIVYGGPQINAAPTNYYYYQPYMPTVSYVALQPGNIQSYASGYNLHQQLPGTNFQLDPQSYVHSYVQTPGEPTTAIGYLPVPASYTHIQGPSDPSVQ